jgi:hypothetical protein
MSGRRLLEGASGEQAGHPQQDPGGDVAGVVHAEQDPGPGDRTHQYDREDAEHASCDPRRAPTRAPGSGQSEDDLGAVDGSRATGVTGGEAEAAGVRDRVRPGGPEPVHHLFDAGFHTELHGADHQQIQRGAHPATHEQNQPAHDGDHVHHQGAADHRDDTGASQQPRVSQHIAVRGQFPELVEPGQRVPSEGHEDGEGDEGSRDGHQPRYGPRRGRGEAPWTSTGHPHLYTSFIHTMWMPPSRTRLYGVTREPDPDL